MEIHISDWWLGGLILWLMLQSIFGGIFFNDAGYSASGWREWTKLIVMTLFICFFGFVVLAILILVAIAGWISRIKWISNLFFIAKHKYFKKPLPKYTKDKYAIIEKNLARAKQRAHWWAWNTLTFIVAANYALSKKPIDSLIPEYEDED